MTFIRQKFFRLEGFRYFFAENIYVIYFICICVFELYIWIYRSNIHDLLSMSLTLDIELDFVNTNTHYNPIGDHTFQACSRCLL